MTPPRTIGRQPAYPYDRGGLTEEDVRRIARAEARALLTSVDARNVYPPRSIPLRTVDAIPVVTALPEGVDGDEVYFDTGEGLWHFRYRPGAGVAYPWVPVGAQAPLTDEIDASESTSSGTYVDLTTTGPSVTVPLPGDYLVEYQARVQGVNAAGVVSVAVGATAASDDDALVSSISNETQDMTLWKWRPKAAAAGDVIAMKYRTSGVSVAFLFRSLRVTPTRVGRA